MLEVPSLFFFFGGQHEHVHKRKNPGYTASTVGKTILVESQEIHQSSIFEERALSSFFFGSLMVSSSFFFCHNTTDCTRANRNGPRPICGRMQCPSWAPPNGSVVNAETKSICLNVFGNGTGQAPFCLTWSRGQD